MYGSAWLKGLNTKPDCRRKIWGGRSSCTPELVDLQLLTAVIWGVLQWPSDPGESPVWSIAGLNMNCCIMLMLIAKLSHPQICQERKDQGKCAFKVLHWKGLDHSKLDGWVNSAPTPTHKEDKFFWFLWDVGVLSQFPKGSESIGVGWWVW